MENWYPSLYKLVSSIWMAFIHEPVEQKFELSIKLAKIMEGKDAEFQKYLEDSQGDITILNSKPYYKKYKILTNASRQQYEHVIDNCKKAKQLKEPQLSQKLQLRFQTQRVHTLLGGQQWFRQTKTQKISKQFIVLAGGKELKMDLNSFLRASGKNILEALNRKQSNVGELAKQVKCIRVSENIVVYNSELFSVNIAKIHQMEKEEQKLELLKLIQENNPELLNKYIQSNLPGNKQNISRYEIELKVPINDRIKSQISSPQFLNTYLGFLIQSLSKLDKEKFDENFESDFFRYVTSSKEFYKNLDVDFDDV